MADTTFTDYSTVIAASWLNDVNRVTYKDIVWAKQYITDLTDATSGLTSALATGKSVVFTEGDYYIDNITMSTNGQQLIGLGKVRFIKRANGVMLTVSGSDCVIQNIQFRGDASTPVYTGDNISVTGDNIVMLNCGSRWAYARAFKCTGQRPRIYGSNDIYQTADSSGSGYDIEIGTSGTATLYGAIDGIQSTQSTGGILLTAPGALAISNSQFGKLTVQPGSSPFGMHGPMITNCRINGAVAVSVSSTALVGCSCSDNVSFTGSISGVKFDCSMSSSKTFTAASTVTNASFNLERLEGLSVTVSDSSLNSYVTRTVRSYNPTWTGATTNPVIGNGTISGISIREGRYVTDIIDITMGSTTIYGSGLYSFSLSHTVNSGYNFESQGVFTILDSGTTEYLGVARATAGQTACNLVLSNGNGVNQASPIAWATNDKIRITMRYQAA